MRNQNSNLSRFLILLPRVLVCVDPTNNNTYEDEQELEIRIQSLIGNGGECPSWDLFSFGPPIGSGGAGTGTEILIAS